AGADKLAAGGSELQQGQAALQQGAEQLAAKLSDAAASGKQLAAGAEELAAGAAELNAGASRAKQGAATIAAGSEQLESGSSELADGTGRLADGSAELSGKLGDAAKESGETSGSDSLYDMFAKPVDVTERDLAGVPNYGTGFAPYFLSLGLFVGALLSTVVLPLRSQTVPPRSGWSRYVGKTGMVTVVAVLQALIADAILLYGIGLEAKDTGLFVAMSLAASFSFMMIIQLLVTTMDNPGRFIGIIVLILQLTGSAGTYPKELIPDWLQKVGDWLPMTYTIAGFRDIISGGDLSHARRQIVVTLLFALPFMALMLLYFLQEQRKGRASGNGSGGDAPAVRPAEA
ncbi:YhgE/Pip family protein, partial [Paenibacillus thailandensis]